MPEENKQTIDAEFSTFFAISVSKKSAICAIMDLTDSECLVIEEELDRISV